MSLLQMRVKIRTLTPIWTGDIDSKSDLLQSTGIMGSLRWWTEAILRGMGKFACDPVENDRCPIKVNKNNQEIAQYCATCLIFGATGLRRMFRLQMNEGEKVFSGRLINIKPNGRNRGWYLGSGLRGDMSLDLIPVDKDFDKNLILTPFTIVAKWGAIGAKTQHGYGVVEFQNYSEIKFEQFKEALSRSIALERLQKLKMEERGGNNNSLPNISEMFSAKVRFEADNVWWKEVDGIKKRGQKGQNNYYEGYVNDPRMVNWINSESVPIAPAIKNWLRYGNGKNLWTTSNQGNDRKIEDWLFGSIRNNKTASRINVSCAYLIDKHTWEFRIWGWIPTSNLPDGFNREGFLDNLKESLSGSSSVQIPWGTLLGNKARNHKLKVWREFDSKRDTVKLYKNNTDNYLQSLLKDD